MKKNKTMRIASVVMMAALLSTCAISGTFAKYTSASTGTDTARVAKWDIRLDDEAISNTFKFDLFETIYDTDATSVETDVATGLIAPGTSGSFEIKLASASEVSAQYSIDYTVTNVNNIPVQFSVNGGTTWTSDLADVTDKALAMTNGTASITVQWKWDFNGNDTTDTELGTAGTAEITVEAVVTVEQVD